MSRLLLILILLNAGSCKSTREQRIHVRDSIRLERAMDKTLKVYHKHYRTSK